MLQRLIDLILNNISFVIFIAFLLFGLISRGDKKESQNAAPRKQPTKNPVEPDGRPLAERMAEYFGVDLHEGEEPEPPKQPKPQSQYASDGRRSPNQRSVQEEYGDLFGGGSLFTRDDDRAADTKWGFDETEWGSTFVKNDEQWGSTFPEKKSSEPVVEWPR